MAATTSVMRKIEVGLRDIRAETDFLPELAALWPDRSQQERDSWYLEWRELMTRLAGLDHAYRSGSMTAAQQTRYRALLRQLEAALPIIEQLDLDRPGIALDAE